MGEREALKRGKEKQQERRKEKQGGKRDKQTRKEGNIQTSQIFRDCDLSQQPHVS